MRQGYLIVPYFYAESNRRVMVGYPAGLLYKRYVNFPSFAIIFGIFYPAREHFNLISAVYPVIVYWVAIGSQHAFFVPVAKCQGGNS